MPSKEILLTGVTGFLGAELFRRFLQRDHETRIHLLVRGSKRESAAARVDRILRVVAPDGLLATAAQRYEIVEGDIALDGLGLAARRYDDLAARIDHIVHGAATVRFDLPLDEARRINVGGTRNLLALADRARALGSLSRFDYVGTAYVAGRRQGVVRENELEYGQAFSNSYEQSKFEAEKLVRSRSGDLPITIFRPSIIVGDSRTGATANFRGFYGPLRLYVKKLILVVPADPETQIDIVPVDYVADAIAYLIESRPPRGECYHITAGLDRTSTVGELTQVAERFFQIPVPRFMRQDLYRRWLRPLLKAVLRGPRREAMNKGEFFLPYIDARVRFDNRNTVRDLDGSGLVAPKPEDYFLRLLRYFKEADAAKGAIKDID